MLVLRLGCYQKLNAGVKARQPGASPEGRGQRFALVKLEMSSACPAFLCGVSSGGRLGPVAVAAPELRGPPPPQGSRPEQPAAQACDSRGPAAAVHPDVRPPPAQPPPTRSPSGSSTPMPPSSSVVCQVRRSPPRSVLVRPLLPWQCKGHNHTFEMAAAGFITLLLAWHQTHSITAWGLPPIPPCSCGVQDLDEYRLSVRTKLQLTVKADLREWIIVHVIHASPADPAGKQARKVFSRIEDHFRRGGAGLPPRQQALPKGGNQQKIVS